MNKSTIVRIIKSIAGPLSAVSPSLAARWLVRLFLTPMRHRAPEREQRWLEGSRTVPFTLEDGRALTVHRWGHEGPMVLLVHGWAGRGSQLGAWVQPLLDLGYQVIALDMPGHGGSEGGQTALPEFARALDQLGRLFGTFDAIVAHSLGTAAVTKALTRDLRARRLVYVAPPDTPSNYLARAAEQLGFSPTVSLLARQRIEATYGEPFDSFDGVTLAPQLGHPLLVLHDAGDRDVPIFEGQALVKAWPNATIEVTEGLGHSRILRDAKVVQRGVQFLHLEHQRQSA